MGKNKGKNRNNSANSNAGKQSKATLEEPKIIVKPSNEIVTTEEGKALVEASLQEAKKYATSKKEEADKYYQEKREQADAEVAGRVNEAVEKVQSDMKDKIAQAQDEAESIVGEANRKAEEILKKNREEQEKLNERLKECVKEKARIESSKTTYKEEVLKDIQNEIDNISSENEKLQDTNLELEKKLAKAEREKKSLNEDIQDLENEIKKNQVRKSDVDSYKHQLDESQTSYKSLNDLYNVRQEQLEKLKNEKLLYGEDPSKAIRENEALTRKNSELNSIIASYPSKEELQQLREKSRTCETLQAKVEELTSEKHRLEEENLELKVDKNEIESYRRFIKILELQRSELQRELDRNIELYNNRAEKIFANLSRIDAEENDHYPPIVSDRRITLAKLCSGFRSYLANRQKNPLYYDEITIRTFIAGFASSRIMILEGLSGTGKSSLPRAFQDYLGAKTIEVPVQSSWKDRNDLLGFYNDFKKQYKETEFLKALYKATSDPDNIYVIVLDEMNLSRIEYYFADMLSVLEKPDVEDWKIELISDYASITSNQEAWPKYIKEGKLQVCDNTWFVGTANRDDSTFMITDKVYDRSVVITFDKKGEKVKLPMEYPIQMNAGDFQRLLDNASKFAKDADEKEFKSMIDWLDEEVKTLFQITFGNRIANQLEKFVPVYVACGGTIEEAVDVMFSRKVLRKLEGLYDEHTKESLDYLKDEIEKQHYHMPITMEAIRRMVEKM